MHVDPTGVHYRQKVAIVCIRTETKNLYIIFIADSSMLATVFACTCIFQYNRLKLIDQ